MGWLYRTLRLLRAPYGANNKPKTKCKIINRRQNTKTNKSRRRKLCSGFSKQMTSVALRRKWDFLISGTWRTNKFPSVRALQWIKHRNPGQTSVKRKVGFFVQVFLAKVFLYKLFLGTVSLIKFSFLRFSLIKFSVIKCSWLFLQAGTVSFWTYS